MGSDAHRAGLLSKRLRDESAEEYKPTLTAFATPDSHCDTIREKIRENFWKTEKRALNPLGFKAPDWQRVKDSNPHIQSQSLLCYPYTNPLCSSVLAAANRYYYTEKRDFVNPFFHFSPEVFSGGRGIPRPPLCKTVHWPRRPSRKPRRNPPPRLLPSFSRRSAASRAPAYPCSAAA